MYTVSFVSKGDSFGNEYAVCRSETWEIIHDHAKFTEKKDAEEYIICNNLRWASPDFLRALSEKRVARSDVIDPKYISFQRYFIGEPPIREMKKYLRAQNIQIVESRENSPL